MSTSFSDRVPLSRGVTLDRDSLGPGDLDLSPLDACLPQWRHYDATSPTQVAGRIADAQVIVTNKVVLDRAALNAAKSLKLICVAATGTNNIDLDAVRERGIAVCNAVNYGTESVAQHCLMLMLNLATQVARYRAAVEQGRWSKSRYFCLLDYPVVELAGKTLGVVGYGTLGRRVAELARAFGMQVLVSARPDEPATGERVGFEQVLAEADILSLHCPLTAHNQHLINRERLAQMKPGAWLINTARGALVDNDALVQALTSGQLGGAGLDVLDQEPPPADHPLLRAALPNLIITPHTAWASREARQRLVHQLADNIAAFQAGTPVRQVNER